MIVQIIPFNYEPNGIPFGSYSKEKPVIDHIPRNFKGNKTRFVFISVANGPDAEERCQKTSMSAHPIVTEPIVFPFASRAKGKCHHDHIPFNLKGN